MNIIVGASGQVGSAIVQELVKNQAPVRAVVRNPEKISDKRVEARKADLLKPEELTEAFKAGKTVFLLTPENPSSTDIIGETRQIIENYRQAIRANNIEKIVALSSAGAHADGNTGNLRMSKMLEESFDDLDVQKVFIRPSYYYSNWLGFMEVVEEHGALPSFFPPDLAFDMNSPLDVARFIAGVITGSQAGDKVIFELTGPKKYTPQDIADALSKGLNKQVEVQPIPKEKWMETLESAGFTPNTSANLADMTQALIDQVATIENPGKAKDLPTGFSQYLKEQLD